MISTSYVVYKRTQCLASLQPGLGVHHRETMKPTTTLRKFNDKCGSLASRSLVELFSIAIRVRAKTRVLSLSDVRRDHSAHARRQEMKLGGCTKVDLSPTQGALCTVSVFFILHFTYLGGVRTQRTHRRRNGSVVGGHNGECGARAYNGGLGAEPPAGSRGRA